MLLKRSTPLNIVIGGAAGAFPPMIAWAAATGGLGPAPLLMFAVIFLWTPPHFWALALYRNGDYARAGVPMMPVVAGEARTRREVLLYTLALSAVAVLPAFTVAGGPVYLAVALVAGAAFLRAAAPSRPGSRPCRCARHPLPRPTAARRTRSSRRSGTARCGPTSTSATRRSASGSATPSCRGSRTSSAGGDRESRDAMAVRRRGGDGVSTMSLDGLVAELSAQSPVVWRCGPAKPDCTLEPGEGCYALSLQSRSGIAPHLAGREPREVQPSRIRRGNAAAACSGVSTKEEDRLDLVKAL